MSQRILSLTGYLLYRFVTSLIGVGYLALSIAFYMFAFRSETPESDYFVLVIGLFGAVVAFLVSLSLTSKANTASNYPILVRLNSRTEYLVAILLAGLSVTFLLQLSMAAVALIRNTPQLSLQQAIEILPIWFSLNALFSVLALHASDFVVRGWSRVTLFGGLAVFMLGADSSDTAMEWLADLVRQVGAAAFEGGTTGSGRFYQTVISWLSIDGIQPVQNFFRLIFWPFEATINAVINGSFTRAEALAPAALLLYATILFMLAADFFATKDIFLTED